MFWSAKRLSENNNRIVVGYNPGGDDIFDGVIIYDKADKDTSVAVLAEGSDEADGKWCAAHVRGKINDGRLRDDLPIAIALG
jgi:hypothetical protein